MHTDKIANPGELESLSCEANTVQMTRHARTVPAAAKIKKPLGEILTIQS